MKMLNLLLAMTTVFTSLNASAQTDRGNGGDVIRNYFIKQGRVILDRVGESTEFRAYLKKHEHLEFNLLYSFLNTQTIQVVKNLELDNTGSVVDAIGIPGKIKLSQKTWQTYISKNIDLDRIIFHELLRAADVNDDEYRISKLIDQPKAEEAQPYVMGYSRVLWKDYGHFTRGGCAKDKSKIVAQDLGNFLMEKGCLISNPKTTYSKNIQSYVIHYKTKGCRKLTTEDVVRAYFDFSLIGCEGTTRIEMMQSTGLFKEVKSYAHDE